MAENVRPAVVTILGHVDHGKTSLLDFIRKTAVAAKEHGGITQAIGAYQLVQKEKTITFIDTPGHAAFEKMRSRGAQVADIAVLVVAVDDGVMPQTIEAIKHIQQAKVPMIVAVNKIDLPGIDVKVQMEKIKRQLSDAKVLVEEYGGDVPIVSLSAKTGQGVDDLLETIQLLAEIHELKGDPNAPSTGVVIESHLDKSKGAIATILVRNGSLKKGDTISVGGVKCKIRGMFDFLGKMVDVVMPSMPVEILGWEEVPAVGAKLGEEIPDKITANKAMASLLDKLSQASSNVLNVIVRADVQGSLEAIETALEKFNEEGQQHLKVLLAGTGEVVDSDVELAATTKAIILAFNVPIRASAKKLAELNYVLIREYKIIYELLDEVKDVVDGMLKPGIVEEVFGRAQIVAEFPYGKSERIAGCKVLEGTISKGPRIRLVRNDEVVAEGKIKSIKRLKEEVAKVERGQECGMMFDNLDFTVGDIIESFRTI